LLWSKYNDEVDIYFDEHVSRVRYAHGIRSGATQKAATRVVVDVFEL
jgi:hypothetical protein